MQFAGTFVTDTERAAIAARAADHLAAADTLAVILAAIACAALLASYATR